MGEFLLRYSPLVVALIVATPALLTWRSGTWKAMGERRKEYIEVTSHERQAIVDRLVEDLKNERTERSKLQDEIRLLRKDLKIERDDCEERRDRQDSEARAQERYIVVLEKALRSEGRELPVRPESNRQTGAA